MSEWRQKPTAVAIRAMMKLPTAKSDEEGVGTGEMDFAFDGIVSKEINQRVELSGFGGFIFRGDPDDVSLSDGFRWGFGAGFPTRRGLRLTAELHGESQFDDVVYSGLGTLIGEDGSLPPSISERGLVDAFLARSDLAETQRLLRGRGRELASGPGWPQQFQHPVRRVRGRDRRRVRLPVPHRLSPRRARLRAAAATAATGSTAGGQARSRPWREGVVQPVHGGSRQGFRRDRRGKQLHQLCRHLQLDGADREADEPGDGRRRRGRRR